MTTMMKRVFVFLALMCLNVFESLEDFYVRFVFSC